MATQCRQGIVLPLRNELLAFRPASTGGYAQVASRSIAVRDLVAADLDGDGVDEIYYLLPPDFPSPLRLGTLDDALATTVEWRLDSLDAVGIAAENIPGVSSPRNVVLLSSSLIVFDPAAGEEVWRTPSLLDTPQPGNLFFFGTPDRPRISFSGFASMYVTN